MGLVQLLVVLPEQVEILQPENALHRGHLLFGQAIVDGVRHEEQAALAVPHDMFHLRGREIRQNGHDDGPVADGRQVGDAPVRAVAPDQPDPIPGLEPGQLEQKMQPLEGGTHLGVGQGLPVQIAEAGHVPVFGDGLAQGLDEIFFQHGSPIAPLVAPFGMERKL